MTETTVYIKSLRADYINGAPVSTESNHEITLLASTARVTIGNVNTRGPLIINVRSVLDGGANGIFTLVRSSTTTVTPAKNSFCSMSGDNNEMVDFEWQAESALSMFHSVIPTDGLSKDYVVYVNSLDGGF